MTLMRRDENFPAWPNLLNEFFGRDWMDFSSRNFSTTNTTLPSVNIKEDDNEFAVELAAPGFEKDDFKIELNNNMLTISSEKKVEDEVVEDQQFTRREFSYQSFNRTFTLPEIVDGEKISAKYDKGILYIQIPKREEAKPKPPKQISIK